MAWSTYNPTAWISGSTIPQLADYQGIYTDLHARGGNVDGGGYGRANTAFITLVPGELPGATHSVTAGSWTGGTATLTIGGHSIGVGQRVSISGITPSGYNAITDSVAVTAVTSTQISYALAANPGAWTSGGTVVVGATPGYGTVAIDGNLNVKVWNGSAWVAATTAASAPVWWVASGAPASGTGSNGDMYLNSATGDVYGPKTAGAWGSVDVNLKGPTGATAVWNVGAGAPSSGTGNNGDMYLNSNNGDIYGPKAAGAWGSVAGNIKGPSGAAGNTEPVNAQTGTSYTFASADASKLVTFSNASAIAGTLPQAGTVGIAAAWYCDVQNRGVGTLTITPTTSTIDGAASIALTTGQGCRIVCDGTNYFTMRGMGGGGYSVGSISATSNTTWSPGYNRTLVKADASGGAFTFTLPSAASWANYIAVIQKIDSSAFAVSIANTVRGTMTISGQWNDYEVHSDGTSWYVI